MTNETYENIQDYIEIPEISVEVIYDDPKPKVKKFVVLPTFNITDNNGKESKNNSQNSIMKPVSSAGNKLTEIKKTKSLSDKNEELQNNNEKKIFNTSSNTADSNLLKVEHQQDNESFKKNNNTKVEQENKFNISIKSENQSADSNNEKNIHNNSELLAEVTKKGLEPAENDKNIIMPNNLISNQEKSEEVTNAEKNNESSEKVATTTQPKATTVKQVKSLDTTNTRTKSIYAIDENDVTTNQDKDSDNKNEVTFAYSMLITGLTVGVVVVLLIIFLSKKFCCRKVEDSYDVVEASNIEMQQINNDV